VKCGSPKNVNNGPDRVFGFSKTDYTFTWQIASRYEETLYPFVDKHAGG
jgi:hypothetical protein